MTHVQFRNEMTVELVSSMGGDHDIVEAARVLRPGTPLERLSAHSMRSAQRKFSGDPTGHLLPDEKGLMRMLMRDRHGTPWEHVTLKFYIEAPIFVAREAHRHRIASINEESGRYKELAPTFYMPDSKRNLVQKGKPGAYSFEPGTEEQILLVRNVIFEQCRSAYRHYEDLLDAGIAREVARLVLPVNIYTSWYLTLNLRSLFNFLSLRNKTEDTTVPTFPQREIEMIAEQMEVKAEMLAPYAMQLFRENGRISP